MPKRDSKYYRDRLKREHPAIFQDLLAGKYASVRQAAAAAGLIHLPTRLDNLKREWKGASAAERQAFANWLKSTLRPSAFPRTVIATPDGKLLPRANSFISAWRKRNRASAGIIMKALGFSNYDYRLAQALATGTALPKEVLDPLSRWMERNGFREKI